MVVKALHTHTNISCTRPTRSSTPTVLTLSWENQHSRPGSHDLRLTFSWSFSVGLRIKTFVVSSKESFLINIVDSETFGSTKLHAVTICFFLSLPICCESIRFELASLEATEVFMLNVQHFQPLYHFVLFAFTSYDSTWTAHRCKFGQLSKKFPVFLFVLGFEGAFKRH